MLQIRTIGGMHGNAATDGNIADDGLTLDWVAAAGPEDEQIIMSLDLDWRVLAPKDPPHHRSQSRSGRFTRFRFRQFRLQSTDDLTCGDLPQSDARKQFFAPGHPKGRSHRIQLRLVLLEAPFELPELLLQKLPADVKGLLLAAQVQETSNGRSRPLGLDHIQPVPAGPRV